MQMTGTKNHSLKYLYNLFKIYVRILANSLDLELKLLKYRMQYTSEAKNKKTRNTLRFLHRQCTSLDRETYPTYKLTKSLSFCTNCYLPHANPQSLQKTQMFCRGKKIRTFAMKIKLGLLLSIKKPILGCYTVPTQKRLTRKTTPPACPLSSKLFFNSSIARRRSGLPHSERAP